MVAKRALLSGGFLKVAITGSNGLFGHALTRVFGGRHEVVPLSRRDFDLTDHDRMREVLRRVQPRLIVHPAGIPDIDRCEREPALAMAVNSEATKALTEIAAEIGAALAYISTDAVFDGKKTSPYMETDPTNPPSVYGRTKLLGEHAVETFAEHWIFRVSVLFGPGKTNFVEKGLRALAAGDDYTVAADQVGSATYTIDAARKILEVVEARRFGLYHLSNQGACSRLEFAVAAAALAGLDQRKIIGRATDQMGRIGPRLKYAVMEMKALVASGFALPRPWREALCEYVGYALAAGLGKL